MVKNKKRVAKKAQFYILAAIIIVLIVITLSSIVTYSVVRTEPKSVSEIEKILRSESSNIVKYGMVSGNVKLDEFTRTDLANYLGLNPDLSRTNITIVYGNGESDTLQAITYSEESSGSVGIGGVEQRFRKAKTSIESVSITDTADGKVKVDILQKEYTFDLKEGENFYFVIVNEQGGETFVGTNINGNA